MLENKSINMIDGGYDVHRTISLLFLVTVGITGVGLNCIALQKAIRVSHSYIYIQYCLNG